MTTRILIGDCRDVLPNSGRFRKGQHWRPRKPHWDKSWLEAEYVTKGQSAANIATHAECTENNILFWLAKHGIPRRSISEVRAAKHWGAAGAANPMFGKRGLLNPHYIDGSSPDRQRLYAQHDGREFIKAVYARDEYRCVRCNAPNTGPRTLHAHHIKPWAGNPALRFEISNAVTLCRTCHGWVHSKRNTKGEFLA
jgi:thymidylate synthase (FAD)